MKRLEPKPVRDPQDARRQEMMMRRARTLFNIIDPANPKSTGYEFEPICGGKFKVWSILHPSGTFYTVDLEKQTCDCPDFAGVAREDGGWLTRPRGECKHAWGLYLLMAEKTGDLDQGG